MQPEIKEAVLEINPVNPTPEDEISKVLSVPELDTTNQPLSDSGNESVQIKTPRKITKFVPSGLKTRAELILKIQESSKVFGNEDEIKGMRLHRRRRNSLDHILREQIAKCVTSEAEKRMGIPPEKDTKGRLEYAVNCLYSFDLCCCKLVEKIVDYVDLGVTVEGLSETIDGDPRIRTEVKDAFRDFILENDSMEWIKSAASPSTRLLLCHLYPLMSVLRAKSESHTKQEISPEVRVGVATAKLRSIVDPPRKAPKQPSGIRVV